MLVPGSFVSKLFELLIDKSLVFPFVWEFPLLLEFLLIADDFVPKVRNFSTAGNAIYNVGWDVVLPTTLGYYSSELDNGHYKNKTDVSYIVTTNRLEMSTTSCRILNTMISGCKICNSIIET